MTDTTITTQQHIQQLLVNLASKSRTFAVFTFETSLHLLQQAALGVVGNLTLNQVVFNPTTIEAAASTYLETFYQTVIKPAEIADLPASVFIEPVLHRLYTAAATAMVKAAVQLVFKAQAPTGSVDAARVNMSEYLIQLSEV